MPKHPYTSFEKTDLWQVLEIALQELVDNDDVKELTGKQYIIGHFAKRLSEVDLLKKKALSTRRP